MGQAERVLMEWFRRSIELLERTLPPDSVDRANERERALNTGVGCIASRWGPLPPYPRPWGRYEDKLWYARRYLDHLEMGGEIGRLMRPMDKWAQHHGHDLTIQQGPPEGGATIILFCRTCDDHVWAGRETRVDDIWSDYAEHLGHDIRIHRDECPEEPGVVFYSYIGLLYFDDGSSQPPLATHLPDGSTLPPLEPGTTWFPGHNVGIGCHTCGNYEGGPTTLCSGRVSEWFDELWNN
jgi:hypothetical protein